LIFQSLSFAINEVIQVFHNSLQGVLVKLNDGCANIFNQSSKELDRNLGNLSTFIAAVA